MKAGLMLLGILLLLVNCTKKPTRWEVDLGAPLINDTLDLSRLTSDSVLVANAQGTLDLDFTKTLLDIGLADLISIPDTQVVQTFHSNFAVNVPPGFNVFNQTETHTIELPGVQLKKVRVFSGGIQLTVYNPLPTAVTFDVSLPGVSLNGITFQQTVTVAAGDNVNPTPGNANFDLAGYEMDLRGPNAVDYNVLQASVTAVSDPNGPTVNVTPAQEFKVEATLKDIALDYARGYFGNQLFSDTVLLDLPIMEKVESGLVDIQSVQLGLSFSNGTKVPIRGALTQIANIHSSGSTVALNAPVIGQDLYLAPATGSWNSLNPSTQQVQVNSGNSNIEQVMENLGSKFQAGYAIEINPNGNLNAGWDEIYSTSRIKVVLHAQMPLQLQADQLTLADTFQVSLKQDASKTHVVGGYFQLDAANAFPMQAQFKLSFLNAQKAVIDESVGDALVLSSVAGLPNASGILVKNSSVRFYLSEYLMQHIHELKYLRVEAVLDTPVASGASNQVVAIPVGAFMQVKVKAALKTEIVY